MQRHGLRRLFQGPAPPPHPLRKPSEFWHSCWRKHKSFCFLTRFEVDSRIRVCFRSYRGRRGFIIRGVSGASIICAAAEVAFGRSSMAGAACRGSNTIIAPFGSTTLMVLLSRWSMDCTTCCGTTTLMALRALVKENWCCMKKKSKGTSSAKTHSESLGCMRYEEEDTCLVTLPPSRPGSAAELLNSGSTTVGVIFA
jgi:hypothetical protein